MRSKVPKSIWALRTLKHIGLRCLRVLAPGHRGILLKLLVFHKIWPAAALGSSWMPTLILITLSQPVPKPLSTQLESIPSVHLFQTGLEGDGSLRNGDTNAGTTAGSKPSQTLMALPCLC